MTPSRPNLYSPCSTRSIFRGKQTAGRLQLPVIYCTNLAFLLEGKSFFPVKLSLNLFTSQYTEGERFTRTMPARIIVITITAFAFIAGSSLEVLRANINKSVWCLRACGLEKDKTLSERVQVTYPFLYTHIKFPFTLWCKPSCSEAEDVI